jgi:hypothetical protein
LKIAQLLYTFYSAAQYSNILDNQKIFIKTKKLPLVNPEFIIFIQRIFDVDIYIYTCGNISHDHFAKVMIVFIIILWMKKREVK